MKSSIQVKDIAQIIYDLSAIKITYNSKIIYADDMITEDNIEQIKESLEAFLDSELPVSAFTATVTNFHHYLIDIIG